MSRQVAGTLSALSVLLLAGGAFADAPAWCKGELADHRISISGGLDTALKGDDPRDAVADIVGWMCHPDDDAKQKMAELEQSRQKWSKRLLMSDDDWVDAATWTSYSQSERNSPTLRIESNVAWSTMDAPDQYMMLTYDLQKNFDANYMADAVDGKLTESGRFGYLSWCLGSNNKEVQWAMCQPDLVAFDPKKVAAELHADKKHNGYERMVVRINLYLTADKLKARADEVKQAAAKDPAYATMFELAATARKTWDASARANASLLALALAMDDARVTNSRRAFAGCDDKTWNAFKAAVGGIAAKKFAGIHDDPGVSTALSAGLGVISGDPEGYLASVALSTCHSGDQKPDPLVRNIGEVYRRWPGYRGPRDAALTAIMQAGLVLDDRSAHIEYPNVYRQWLQGDRSSSGGGAGVVASVKPQGDKVRIEFAPQMVKETRCLSSKRTNRITQIRSDGSLVYEVNCLKEGTVTVDTRSSPQTVNKRYTQGVRPGMGVSIIEDVVGVAWPKAGAKVPSMVAGVAVK